MNIQFDPENPERPILYHYQPSEGAGYAFMALFGLATVGHLIAMFWHRSWFFIPMIIGGVCETFGYYGRALSAKNSYNIKPFVQQSMLILAAPPFLAATIYISLRRMTIALTVSHDVNDETLHPAARNLGWISKTYIFIDVLVLITQVAGTGLQATGDERIMSIGQRAVVAGLIFQLVAFAIFAVIVLRVQKQLSSMPSVIMQSLIGTWKRYFGALYAVSLCVFVRGVVRTVEYAQGGNGEIATREVYIYVFDGSLMFILMILFLVLSPGTLIEKTRSWGKDHRALLGEKTSADRQS